MEDFTPTWKELANSKKLTFTDFVYRAVFIAMRKSTELEDQIKIAQEVLEHGLTPITNKKKLANGRRPYDVVGHLYPGPFGWMHLERPVSALGISLEGEELKRAKDIWMGILNQRGRFGVHYSFIFLYGDLIPEQRCIQMAHAAMKMGQRLTQENAWPPAVNANNLHYTMIGGSKYWEDDARKLDECGIKYVTFLDHDYSFGPDGELIESLGYSMKSIMTYPIHHSKRKHLQDLELYRFE